MSSRLDVTELVRDKDDQVMVECPVCGVEVKARNLLRHFDRVHGSTAPSDEPSPRAATNSRPSHGPTPAILVSDPLMDCEPLLELATADIYRSNLFRVLGLDVGASGADVRRRQAKAEMARELGLAPQESSVGPLALDPRPSKEAERAALQRLSEPLARLLDEVFWFWPLAGAADTDEALGALRAGRLDEASRHWEADGRGGVGDHNLAVLHHLRALDGESSSKPDARAWEQAFEFWIRTLDGEEFWSALRQRVVDLNDQQVTTGLPRRVRATLPKALLLINFEIAIEAAERGAPGEAGRLAQIARDSGFDTGLVDEALSASISPLRRRLTSAIEAASARWAKEGQRGNEHVAEFERQARSILEVVDSLLEKGDMVRTALHDTVAETMLRGQIAYGNKTNDYETSNYLLRCALDIAEGASMRDKISEQIDVVIELTTAGNHWYSPGYWDLDPSLVERLEAANEDVEAGKYDESIEVLVDLHASDPGPAIVRCLAYCLSIRGIRESNEALREFNAESKVISRILDTLREQGTYLLPYPEMQAWEVPPCPHCGSTNYTQWANFTYEENKLFMCSTCSDVHSQEEEAKKAKLRVALTGAMGYLLLARQLDPDDKGVERNLKAVDGLASEVVAPPPSLRRLRKKLGLGTSRTKGKERDSVDAAARRPRLRVAAFVGAVLGAGAFAATTQIVAGSGVPLSFHFFDRVYFTLEAYVPELGLHTDSRSISAVCYGLAALVGSAGGLLVGAILRGERNE